MAKYHFVPHGRLWECIPITNNFEDTARDLFSVLSKYSQVDLRINQESITNEFCKEMYLRVNGQQHQLVVGNWVVFLNDQVIVFDNDVALKEVFIAFNAKANTPKGY